MQGLKRKKCELEFWKRYKAFDGNTKEAEPKTFIQSYLTS